MIGCMYCPARGVYGDTMKGWRLAKNQPFRYVCPACVAEGKEKHA